MSPVSPEEVLRVATLVDKGYQPVHEVVVPSGSPWPEAIRWGQRIFTQYHYTMPATVEAAKAAERSATYREIGVWDATV